MSDQLTAADSAESTNDTESTDSSLAGSRRSVLKSMGALGAGSLLASEIEGVEAHEHENHLAQTPPMGWNSWNHFHCDIDQEVIEETADAFVESGMKDVGYEYVNIDDCWMLPERDEDGNLVPDPETFPDGIDGVADYVHDLGLQLGIYSSAGTKTCQGLPASLGHEKQDAQSFADWGVDYLKHDNCYNQGVDPKVRYERMWDALESVDRDIVKSQCSWGSYDEWTWAADLGANLWRTTGDITDSWSRVMEILDQQVGLAEYAGPGHWNDPDMLEVGNAGLSTSESRAHFSLWCVLAAPLLAGNDVREMDEETREILTNEEVIAIDQDLAGIQGTRRKKEGDHEVWAKPLENGDVAVCLLNRGDSVSTVSVPVEEFDLDNAAAYVLRDLWAKEEVATANAISAAVPSHDVALFRVRPGQPDDAPPATTVTVENDDLTIQDGTIREVTTSLTNEGSLAIEDVALSLTGPDGWETSAVTSGTHPNTAPSKSVETTWRIEAPDDTAPGTYEFTLDTTFTWDDGMRSHATSTGFSMEVPLDPLPEGYQTFASTDATFGANDDAGTVVVEANGTDVWADDDQYGAVYRPDSRAAVNSRSVVKVHSQEVTSDWAKAGLMIRNDVTGAGESPGYAVLAATPGNGIALQYDSDGDGYLEGSATAGESTYPIWLRLDRSGNAVTGFYSTDGESWTEVITVDVPEAAGLQDVAMFACSHSEGTLSKVAFSDFTVTNEAGLAVSAADDGTVPRGDTEQVTATFTNYEDQVAEDLSLVLRPPDGWTASVASPTSTTQVAPGESFTATWDVTPPADATAGDHEVTSSGSYTVAGTGRSIANATSLSVPPAPPTGDTYLSDHEWVSATTGWGSIGLDESGGGNTLTIGDQTYDKGLGVHAESRVDYYLDGNLSQFEADVGIDDEVDSDVASVIFRIVGDGTVLAETDVLGAADDPVSLDVDIAGVDVLSLIVDEAGDTIDYDHADWAIAHVLA